MTWWEFDDEEVPTRWQRLRHRLAQAWRELARMFDGAWSRQVPSLPPPEVRRRSAIEFSITCGGTRDPRLFDPVFIPPWKDAPFPSPTLEAAVDTEFARGKSRRLPLAAPPDAPPGPAEDGR
jgi:hypothetical protein